MSTRLTGSPRTRLAALTALMSVVLAASSAGAATGASIGQPRTLPSKVAWTSSKSTFATVATGAARVVVRVDRGINAKVDRYSMVVTTNAVKIASFIAKINALPPATASVEFCPMDVGATVTLRFDRAGATTPYASVVADSGGCGFVTIYQYGSTGALLGTAVDSGGAGFSQFVATSLGIKKLAIL